jgi:hypothetical protein
MVKSALLGFTVLAMLAYTRATNILKGSTGFAHRLFSREINKKYTKLANLKSLLDKTDVFVFDCDGVLW